MIKYQQKLLLGMSSFSFEASDFLQVNIEFILLIIYESL